MIVSNLSTINNAPTLPVEPKIDKQLFRQVFKEQRKTFKYLRDERPKLLVMFSGVPGMGKTTVAKELESKFHAIRISSDELRLLFYQKGVASRLLDHYIIWCIKKISKISSNHFIILDRSIDKTYSAVAEFAQEHLYDTMVIRMQVEKRIVEERVRSRGKDAVSLLQGSETSWRDYENFGREHTVDHSFNNNGPLKEPLNRLSDVIQYKLAEKTPFNRLQPESPEFKVIRNIILESYKLPFSKNIGADCHEVLKGLYLGNQVAADTQSDKFSHILCLRASSKKYEGKAIHKMISIVDGAIGRLPAILDETYDFIDSTTDNILVHCKIGASRSAIVVIAYLMRKFKVPYVAALEFVCRKRLIIKPDNNFVKEIIEWEKKLYSP